MQILVVFGAGMIIYALFGIFASNEPGTKRKKRNDNQSPSFSFPGEDPGKEQKIQRLQNHITELESQLEKRNAEYAQEESAFMQAKENEAKLLDELRRRDEWVAKAEAELTKIKQENSDFNNKFIAKEKELEAGFANNVNLTRQLNEAKAALTEKETQLRAKDDEIQAQKHKIEDQLKTIKEHLGTITEFNKKEKISEWVPKEEFNKLNDEYSQLENELEESSERLKSFAEEIAHLRQETNKKIPPIEEIKPEEVKPAEVKPEEDKALPENTEKADEIKPGEAKGE